MAGATTASQYELDWGERVALPSAGHDSGRVGDENVAECKSERAPHPNPATGTISEPMQNASQGARHTPTQQQVRFAEPVATEAKRETQKELDEARKAQLMELATAPQGSSENNAGHTEEARLVRTSRRP